MSLFRARAAAAFVFGATLSLTASAAEAASQRPREDVPEAGEARRAALERPRRPIAVTINPLAIVIQRYGGNVELAFLPHHVATMTGYMQTVPVEMVRPFAGNVEIRDRATAPSFGGEIGYRLYSGARGAEGLFVGGSLLAMPVAYPRLERDLSVGLERVYGFGGAIDIGAQHITSFGLTIGGGLGASYVGYDLPDDPQRLPYAMPRVLPRLLLQTGYAF